MMPAGAMSERGGGLDLLGRGAYGLGDASKLTRVHANTVRRWFVGWGDRPAWLQPDLPAVEGRYAISFLDLVDLLVVGALRKRGFSLARVQKFYRSVQDRLGVEHAFATQRLLTTDDELFLELAKKKGRGTRIEDPVTQQNLLDEVVKPHLQPIDYDADTAMATLWRIFPGVVVNPRRCFGAPSLEDCAITTWVVANAYRANGDDENVVAAMYQISPAAVLDAIAFETSERGNLVA